jgi:hypothetical protein
MRRLLSVGALPISLVIGLEAVNAPHYLAPRSTLCLTSNPSNCG